MAITPYIPTQYPQLGDEPRYLKGEFNAIRKTLDALRVALSTSTATATPSTSFPAGGGATTLYGGLQASVGNLFQLTTAITLSNVIAAFQPAASGDIYTVSICTVNSAKAITGTVATASNPYTATGTAATQQTFNFSSVTLSAGQLYAVVLILTNKTTTTACKANYFSTMYGHYEKLPLDHGALNVAYSSSTEWAAWVQNAASPTSVAAGTSNNNAQFLLGLVWQ